MIDSADPPAPDGTRLALLEAGIRLFGHQGFAANTAPIAYHFGGKERLRLACAQEFGRRMGAAMAAARARPPTWTLPIKGSPKRPTAGFARFGQQQPAVSPKARRCVWRFSR